MTLIQSVTGPIESSQLGVCLSHEHILNDITSWWHPPHENAPGSANLADAEVCLANLWSLRHDPFASRDNCRLDDLEIAVDEVNRFAALGGNTILEATSQSIGRDPLGLRQVSERTGVNIVMGTGLYLDSSQPPEVDKWAITEIVDAILTDVANGEDGIRPGFIGEIGVGSDFTPRERRSLIAASIAQRESGLPMQVHMPGWSRLGDQVIEVIEENGANLGAVVLCHSNPSGDDLAYQEALLARGVWLQYDMIGMDFFFADQQVQCPSDEDNARNIVRLIERGWADRLLLSSDVFLKNLLRANGGPGYGHILEFFIPRLERHGLANADAMKLLTENVPRLFQAAATT